MSILITILIIQLLIYVVMIVWSYFDLSNDKKNGNRHSVTIRKVFSYWLGVCYIPISDHFVYLLCLQFLN